MHEEEARSVRKFPRKALAVLGVVVIVASGVVVAAATASTKSHKASVQVCVLLPDTKSSVRWVQFDAPAMKAAFAKAGVTARQASTSRSTARPSALRRPRVSSRP